MLHGHQHVPFISVSSRASATLGGCRWPTKAVFVVGGGSAGAAMAHLLQEAPYNTIGLYEPTASGYQITVERISATMAEESIIDTELTR